MTFTIYSDDSDGESMVRQTDAARGQATPPVTATGPIGAPHRSNHAAAKAMGEVASSGGDMRVPVFANGTTEAQDEPAQGTARGTIPVRMLQGQGQALSVRPPTTWARRWASRRVH